MDNNLSSNVTWREENQSPTDLNPSDENKNILLPLISELKNGQSTNQNRKETDKQKAEAISNASQIIDRLQEELKNKDEKIDALRRKNDELKKTKPGIHTEFAVDCLIVGGDYSSDGNWKTQYSEICAKDEIIKKLKEDLQDKDKVINHHNKKIKKMSIAIKNALIKKDDEIREKDDEIMIMVKVINQHNNNIIKKNRENNAIKMSLIEKDKKLKENDEVIKELQEKNESYKYNEFKYNELKKKEEEINNNYGGMEQYNVLVTEVIPRKDEIIDKKSVEIAEYKVEVELLRSSNGSLTNKINELKKNQLDTNNSI